MKRKRLTFHRDVLRHLVDLTAVHGAQVAQTQQEASCETTACPTYKDVTCASFLPSCLTQPNYC